MQINFLDTKKAQRDFVREQRKLFAGEQKQEADFNIFKNLLSLSEINGSKVFLTYISVGFETDTRSLIQYFFDNKNSVAVPKCGSEGKMDFYKINNFNDLVQTGFGILEPVPNIKNKISDFSDCICITPGMCFDRNGFRIGYGGGFYDRFFALHNEVLKIGLCYEKFLADKIERDQFDLPVDIVVTDKHIIRI